MYGMVGEEILVSEIAGDSVLYTLAGISGPLLKRGFYLCSEARGITKFIRLFNCLSRFRIKVGFALICHKIFNIEHVVGPGLPWHQAAVCCRVSLA
jgi:hypothetical protein